MSIDEKKMALAHTILTLLLNEPCSGYDIGQAFQEYVNCFWSATTPQIYRELSRMEAQGWITVEVIPQDGRPNKKIYSVTETGKQELLNWLAEASEPTPIREELLVKVMGGYLVPKEVILKELRLRRQIHEKRAIEMREKEQQEFLSKESLSPQQRLLYIVLQRGIAYEEDWIRWCDGAIEQITEMEF